MSEDTINYLARQILNQNTTKYWTGEGFGSAEANAKDMAKILSSIGITDIRQFGQVDKYEPVTQIGFELNGRRVQNPRPGVYYEEVIVDVGDGSYTTRRDLTPQEAAQVKPVYGIVTASDEYGPVYTPVDSATVREKDGQLQAVTGQTYGNKETGQVVPNTYGERQNGNAWGGTFAGSGNTGYRVEFADNGLPVFYTTYASSSDFADLAPMISIALMATGAGALAGSALTSAVGVTTAAGFSASTVAAASSIAGSALIGGTLAELSGGDFLKGAVTGAVTAGASNAFAVDIGNMLGLEGKLAEQVGKAIISGAKAEISGGDFVNGAAISGLISTVSETTGFTEKDIKSTISAVAAIDSGDPLRIATAFGNMTKLDYFKEDKASEIMTKLSNNDYSVNADYTLGPKTDGLGLTAPPVPDTTFNADGTVNYDLFDFGKTTTGEGFKMPTNPNLEEMGGGQGITTGPKQGYVADLGDPNSFINKPAPDVKVNTTVNKPTDLSKGLLAAGTIYAGQQLFGGGTDTGSYQVGKYSEDIYKDAPIKGFAMRKFEDEAGNTKYIPFIGDRPQLTVPQGYKFVGFNKGGFVSRRS